MARVTTRPSLLRLLLLSVLAFLSRAHGEPIGSAAGTGAQFEFAELYAPMDFAVIGQAKSGTSTLWWNIVQHPRVKAMGNMKETHYWQGETGESHCDKSAAGYNEMAAHTRLKFNSKDLVLGDFSTTYLSCPCCPAALKMINPRLKVIVMLRDPIKRALSRFIEQRRNENFPLHKQVAGLSFAAYSEGALDKMQACLARAAAFRARDQQQQGQGNSGAAAQTSNGGGGAAVPRGLASVDQQSAAGASTSSGSSSSGPGARAGYGNMDLARWLELQCYKRNSIVGWSVYAPWIQNWMWHFPREQILVLYTEDLAAKPLEVMRQVEAFLNVTPHQYEQKMVTSVFNSRECYHWQCMKDKQEIKPIEEESTLGHAVSRLVEFYRPYMQQLITWGEQGVIPPVPNSWRTTYRR